VTDTVKLELPKDELYHGVARLVVGGLAARLEFSYEHLEDLQLALDSFLAAGPYVAGDRLTIELTVTDEGIGLRAGPVADALRAELDRDVDESEGVGLGRLLSTLVENVEIESDGGSEWLLLEKRLPGKTVTRA
jgi:anti-sigma regulatory factor (Ser/Thr protein kinase)